MSPLTRVAWGVLLVSLGIQYWAHSTYAPSRPLVEKGATAPALSLQGLDGEQTSLEGLRGQVVVLDFWATWCAPCRAQFDKVAEWLEDAEPKLLNGVALLAVNVREDSGDVKTFADQNHIPFSIALDPTGSVARAYGVDALPTMVVIDREGRVVAVHEGFSPLIAEKLELWLTTVNTPENP